MFDVDVENGKVSNSKVFADMPKPSITDGMRADRDGRIWCSVGWGDPNENGVRRYSPASELIGKIHIPETGANVCFGGMHIGAGFMAAVVAHNDIPFIVGNSAQGVLWPVGVTAYGGRKATDAWERALDGVGSVSARAAVCRV